MNLGNLDWTLKYHPGKLNPSVVAVTRVFLALTFIPLSLRNVSILWSNLSLSSFGFKMYTQSSAYLMQVPNSLIRLSFLSEEAIGSGHYTASCLVISSFRYLLLENYPERPPVD